MDFSYKIEDLVSGSAKAAMHALYGKELLPAQIQFQKTRKEFAGDITLVVFPLTKFTEKGPEETGNAIGQFLKNNIEEIADFNVVKGFLNIAMSDQFWCRMFAHILEEKNFGKKQADSLPRVMVEYSSPNTNKPLHLGHLRNNFLGYSVSEILKAAGHKVTKVQIINDRGIHICKSMVAWQQFGQGETPESAQMKGDKLVGKYYVAFDKEQKRQIAALIANGISEEAAADKTQIMQAAQEMLRKWESRDTVVMALWKQMNAWVYAGFAETYKRMGVDFDKLYYESDTYLLGKEEVEKGLAAGIFFQKDDGSIWIDLTDEGLDQKALLRKDGTAMYITQDIGTAILRFRDFPDTAYQMYTVGNEQEYHFAVLFKILLKLGFKQAAQCHHLSYGMVELPDGKMKSREGTVVDADDLMSEMADVAREVAREQNKLEGLPDDEKEKLYQQIGMAALKYFLLRVDPKKNMQFDPKESIDFNGNTGPSIQYTYVRTQAILRKAKASDAAFFSNQIKAGHYVKLHKGEAEVVKKIYEWPQILEEAAASYNPATIAHYCYDLARTYNSFYQDNNILREEDELLRSLRLAITSKSGEVIKDGMELLGIEMPERM